MLALWAQAVAPPPLAARARAVTLPVVPFAAVSSLPPAATVTAQEYSLALIPLTTPFSDHTGIDHHDAAQRVIVSSFTTSGVPHNLELLDANGAHQQFSNIAGLNGQIRITTARDDGQGRSRGGFVSGDLFMGTPVAGAIARVSRDGRVVQNPWVTLLGESGSVAGGLIADRTGVFGGDLIAATTRGGVWRINAGGVATRVAELGTRLEGVAVVPQDPARYGPWAGKILVCAPERSGLYAIDPRGNVTLYSPTLSLSQIHIVPARENLYGIDPDRRKILGVSDDALTGLVGDIIAAQTFPGALYRVHWNGATFDITQIAQTSRWGQLAFSPAGLAEIHAVKQLHDRLAIVRHAPSLNSGRIDGALWQLLGEDVTLDGSDVITSDLLVPGTPTVVRKGGKPAFAGVIEGDESPQPAGYTFTIGSNASLRHLITRTDPIDLEPVAAPPAPAGTRDVTLTNAKQSVGPFATLRNLSLSGSAGTVAVPPGTYGSFSATAQTAFVLGVENSVEPARYNLQELTLAGGSELRLAGPVEITVARGVKLSGSSVAGVSAVPRRLLLRVADVGADADADDCGANTPASGGVSVCGNAVLYAIVRAPEASLNISGSGRLRGTSLSDRLSVNGNGVLEITENDVPAPPINRPPSADAGGDQVVTLPTDTVTLTGSGSDDGLPHGSTLAFEWTAVSGPGMVVFGDATSANTTAQFPRAGIYVLRLTVSDSLLTAFDEMRVEMIPRNEAPTVDAGSPQTVDLPNTAALNGTVSDDGLPSGSSILTTWSVASGPGPVTFGDTHAKATTAAFSQPGTYVLKLTASDSELETSADVTVTVRPLNAAPDVNAGVDQTITFPDFAPLTGVATDDGLPSGSTLSTTWSKVRGPGAVTFGNPSAPATTVSFSAPGEYGLRLDASDSQYISSDEVTITVSDPNNGPAVNAGVDQAVTFPSDVQLDGTATDDGLPGGSALSVSWARVAGPGAVAFTSPNTATTKATFAAAGKYLLRLSASDSVLTSSDDVVVTVGAANLSPSVNAGSDQAITLPNTAYLSGVVNDDGWPAVSPVTLAWALVSGPGPVDFDTPHAIATVARFSVAGTYVVRLSADDSELTGHDDVAVSVDAIVVNQPPSVSAGADQTVIFPASASLTGAVADDGLPVNAVSVTWQQVSGPGTIQFADATNTAISASFSAPGVYVVRLTASDSELTGSDDVSIEVRTGTVDLTIAAVTTTALVTDPQTLVVSGAVTIDIANHGSDPSNGSFQVVVFEDRNANRRYDAGNDNLLGVDIFTGTIAPDDVEPFTVPVSGIVAFGGSALYATVDSLNQIAETDENNNTRSSTFGASYQPAPGDFALKVKWQFTTPAVNNLGVNEAPLVVPLIDTNDDGVVNAKDVPAVIVFAGANFQGGESHLYAFTGDMRPVKGTNSPIIFDLTSPYNEWGAGTNPAVGDLDGDGIPEVVIAECCRSVIHTIKRIGNTWQRWWQSPVVNFRSSPMIADLDSDSRAEIFYGWTVFNYDGTIRWQGSPLVPSYFGGVGQTAASTEVADLDRDGKLEVIRGPSVFDRDGNVMWYWQNRQNFTGLRGTLDRGKTIIDVPNAAFSYSDAHVVVGEAWDGDPYPELFAVASAAFGLNTVCFESLTIFEHDGRIKNGFPKCLYQDIINGNTFHAGPPTLVNVDHDPEPEILIPASRNAPGTINANGHSRYLIAAYEVDGTRKWQRELLVTGTNGVPPASAADLDGDGLAEVFFKDEQFLYVFDGMTGATLARAPSAGHTGFATFYPVVADADNDGITDILVSQTFLNGASALPWRGVALLSDTKGNFRNGRRIWNQWLYRITNVNEQGGIPALQAPNWETYNNSRTQTTADGTDPLAAPDLAVSRFTIDSQACPTTAGFTVRVGNSGSLQVGHGQRVRFYSGDPAAGGVLIGTAQTTRPLFPGEYEDVTLTNVAAPFPSQVFATVAEPNTSPRVQSANLSRLPFAWAETSAYCVSCLPVSNFNAYNVIDGASNTNWRYLSSFVPTTPVFVGVHFPFPVEITSVTTENAGAFGTAILTAHLEFSNGDVESLPLTASGAGTVTFAEKKGITWVRLVADTVATAGPSISELIVGGSYVEPQFNIKEATGGEANNTTFSAAGLAPCDPSVEQPPFVDSAPPINATAGHLYSYQTHFVDPNNDALSFTLLTAPAGMTISATGLITWTPASAQVGNHVITIAGDDHRGGIAEQRFTLHVRPENQQPTVRAGPDLSMTQNKVAVLNATVQDDGLPDGSTLTAAWTMSSGPGAVTFGSATAIATTATFGAVGTYRLRLSVTDSEFTVVDEVDVVVDPTPANQPPVVNAGGDQAILLPNKLALFTNVSDDGLPAGSTVTSEWTKVSGSGSVTFTSTFTNVVTAIFSEPGLYVLRLTASDTELSASDDIAVSVAGAPVNHAPTVNAGVDRSINQPDSASLAAIVSDDGLPANGVVTTLWSQVSGPEPAIFANPAQAATTVTFPVTGSYVLRLSASDAELTGTDDVLVEVFDPITGPGPTVSIQSPAAGSAITSPTQIVGSISGGNWRLEYSLNEDDGSNNQTWTVIAAGSSPVNNGVLGTFDPTLLLNGVYGVRLVSRDSSGQTSIVDLSAVVQGEQKVGNFSLSFIDLDVPLAGLPIQVIRTYDSRDRRKGDFGVGWTLGIKNARLEKSGKLGQRWEQTRSGGLFSTYCLQPTRAAFVTITFQDGKVYQFEPVATPRCQPLTPIQFATVAFRQLPGLNGTAGATLESLGGLDVVVSGTVPGPVELLDLDTFTTFNPSLFKLTTAEGDVYVIDQKRGVRSRTDANGNTLTIDSSGIFHSSGKSVTFTRDAQGRVIAITDPAGRSMTYAQDVSGDLARFSDRENHETTFTYNNSHGLLTITDARGIQPLSNEYDGNGRLVRHIDSFGKEIRYTHDLDTRQEIVTDRLGNVTVHEYDGSGNIVKTTDAEGGVTSFTYDARGNKLSVTNAIGKTTTYAYDALDNKTSETDPLGNTIRYTYDSRRQLLTATDARGGVTTNTYDAKGNLLSTKDPRGHVTSYTYSGNGLQTSVTNALGHLTRSEYDAAGNRTKEINALGHSIIYAYDANGSRVAQTATRTNSSGAPDTLVTAFDYDRLGQLSKLTRADGSSIEVTRNSIGKESVTKDPLGRETTYEYDAMGQLVRTSFPDGTDERSAYDAEGRRVVSIDRAGRQTRYRYDKIGRLIETIFPDNTKTTAAYDAMGRRSASTDERGNTTTYVYDPNCGCAGRQTAVIDALGHVTAFTYDASGNRLTMTDATGSTTRYEYDANNRRTRVEYPDGTATSTVYDALGRTIAITDQAGNATSFEHDSASRLVKVTDAQGQTTTFTYDEVGNRLSQTDANRHSTTFEYDKMGRRVRRTLPVGMDETLEYDAAGNLLSRTDFNGKTTTYAYDALRRLLSKTPDPSLHQPGVSFTYTATGQRSTMSDASGTATYVYDLRDRLTSKTTPQGTLDYTYDAAGNLLTIGSSNLNGVSRQYAYDALNRLTTATDGRLPAGHNATTYAYDDNGNLNELSYPNGVRSEYVYNSLNRLTDLTVSRAQTFASYSYSVGAAGNRLSVAELSGRRVSYTYDALYRLTNETIGSDPGGINGTVDYTYDSVGNRLSRTSTVVNLPSGTHAYDANDRLIADTYDGNGNTTASSTNTYSYDFENRLNDVNGGGVRIVYDGDGNRVAKSVGGVTTRYLVDTNNLTGYAQVVEEIVGGSVQRVYTYGLDLISQRQLIAGNWITSFYSYDGHGSVRLLTDSAGEVTDTYTYDAFGSLITRTGTTPNDYLYAGEQLDPNLGFYYLRARYMNAATGRFLTMDTYEGRVFEPASLHKYTYANADPVNRRDPSGNDAFLISLAVVVLIVGILVALAWPKQDSSVADAGPPRPQFDTPDAAALDALSSDLAEKTRATRSEWGGLIYRTKTMKFSYNEPVSDGRPDGVDVFKGNLVSKSNLVAFYHTHLISECFSPEDIHDFAMLQGLDAYVLTPIGFVLKYDRGENQTSQVGTTPSGFVAPPYRWRTQPYCP